MNDIIRYVLPKYLDYIDVVNLSLTCKYYNELLKPILIKLKNEKNKQIEDFFSFYIIDIVSKEKLLNSRYIKWNPDWKSEIDLKDFNQFHGSIAYTRDEFNRSFIFVKIKVESPVEYHLPYTNYTVMTIYQKYSDIQIYFLSDPNNFCITTMNNGVFIEREYYFHLKNFFSEGKFFYSEFPYEFPFQPLYEKVYIFNDE